MTRFGSMIGGVALACAVAAPAQAAPIVGQTLIATGGDIVVTFVSNDAGYTSELYLDGPVGDDVGLLFNNWDTAVATSVNLGAFDPGTEMIFRLEVLNTGDVFYTGAGERNEDGLLHAAVDGGVGHVTVGFEDLFGGGDLDYDDLVFSFTNVSSSAGEGTANDPAGSERAAESPSVAGAGVTAPLAAVDEPASLMLLGSGLVAVVMMMKRQAIKR